MHCPVYQSVGHRFCMGEKWPLRSVHAAAASERLAKRVKGLLNRLAEANVQPTVLEAAALLQSEGRRPGMQALTQQLLQVSFSPWSLPAPRCALSSLVAPLSVCWLPITPGAPIVGDPTSHASEGNASGGAEGMPVAGVMALP